MRRPRREKARGFTLLEMLVAMGLLTVGLTSILALFSFGAALLRTSRERERAAIAVEAIRADLAAGLFPLEPDGTVGDAPAVEDRPVPNDPRLRYSARLEESPGLPGEVRVEILLTFREKGKSRSEVYRTILLKEVPFARRMRERGTGGR